MQDGHLICRLLQIDTGIPTWFHGTKPHTPQSPKQKSPVSQYYYKLETTHRSKERFGLMDGKRKIWIVSFLIFIQERSPERHEEVRMFDVWRPEAWSINKTPASPPQAVTLKCCVSYFFMISQAFSLNQSKKLIIWISLFPSIKKNLPSDVCAARNI